MSANNVWIVHKLGDTYYGWDEMAEANVNDEHNGRELTVKGAIAKGKTIEEVNAGLIENSPLGYAEYGLQIDGNLPKDDTPISYFIKEEEK